MYFPFSVFSFIFQFIKLGFGCNLGFHFNFSLSCSTKSGNNFLSWYEQSLLLSVWLQILTCPFYKFSTVLGSIIMFYSSKYFDLATYFTFLTFTFAFLRNSLWPRCDPKTEISHCVGRVFSMIPFP